jgi:membrane dipeptidase
MRWDGASSSAPTSLSKGAAVTILMNTELTRRSLMCSAGAAAAAVAMSEPTATKAATRPRGKPHLPSIVINSLGGLEDSNVDDFDAPHEVTRRVIDDALASGTTAVNMTLGYVSGDGDPFESSVRDIVKWDGIIHRYSDQLMKVESVQDIERAKAAGKLGIFYGFQNGVQLGDEADRVDLFADMGVRVFQLTYNPQNKLGGGSSAPEDTPLTAFGREVIDRANARRVMVDLSHSGRQTCLDAGHYSKQPICISHTGCRALADLPRNKSDEELRLVAERGGYVGIYFMPYLAIDRQITGDDVVRHIEHAISICGEDVVGIGTDGTTTNIDDLERWKRAFARQLKARRDAGIAAAGERPDLFIFAIDMYGPDQFRILADKLARRGHPQERIDKILGGNFMRYARSVWG